MNVKIFIIFFMLFPIILTGCGGGPWGVIETERSINLPTWSPDGKNVVFAMDVRLFRRGSKKMGSFMTGTYDDEDQKIAMSYLIKIDLQTKVIDILLKKEMGDYYSIVYSSPLWRGNKLFFIDSGNLDVMDVNNKSITNNILSNVYRNGGDFRISRSGNYIVYWGTNDYANQSWNVINWDGTGNKELIAKSNIAPKGVVYLLGWSKTEDKIYFSTKLTSTSTEEKYFEVNPQGSITQIPNEPKYENQYDDESLSPDKNTIIYYDHSNLFLTNYIPGQDASGGEDITFQITNNTLGLSE